MKDNMALIDKNEESNTNINSETKRIEWVDVVKYFCIVMVMLSHLESNTVIWSTFYTPFFLTAFLFSSGYVYKPKQKFGGFLYKKVRQLFVPWLVFSLINIFLSQIISFNEHTDLLEDLKWNFLQIRGVGDEVWFVAALFIAFIPFYFIINLYEKAQLKFKKDKSVLIVSIIAVWLLSLASTIYSYFMPSVFPWDGNALPWHIEYVFIANFFMFLGYVFRHKCEGYFDKLKKMWILAIIWVIYLLLVYIPLALKIEFVIVVNILYTYISQIFGVATIILTAKMIKSNKYFDYVGQNTLIYFAFHGKVYSLIQTLLKRFLGNIYSSILANVALSSVFALCFSLLISVILIIPAWIINRWLPFLVGRKYPKKEKEKQKK